MNLAATTGASNPYVAARRLAAQGLAVFPVRGKQPLTAHGVYSATCDASALDAFDWSRADGCGLATGEVSGVDVLDVDVRPRALPRGDRRNPSPDSGGGEVNGLATLAGLGALPETLAALTPSGGRHFYFHHIASSRSKKLADGSVEWFSDKKLVVVPPAQGREWLSSAEVAAAPDWLKAMVLAEDKALTQGGEGNSSGPLVSTRNGSSNVPRQIYQLIIRGMRGAESRAQRRVRGLWANLAAKCQRRNDGLNYTAWQFREFVKSGDLDLEIATKLLRLACQANGYLAKDGEDVVKEVVTRVFELQPNEGD